MRFRLIESFLLEINVDLDLDSHNVLNIASSPFGLIYAAFKHQIKQDKVIFTCLVLCLTDCVSKPEITKFDTASVSSLLNYFD